MPFRFVVCPDPDYHNIDEKNLRFAKNEKDIAKMVQQVSPMVQEGGICVYELKELHKMVEKPKFAKYQLNSNGEILPI